MTIPEGDTVQEEQEVTETTETEVSKEVADQEEKSKLLALDKEELLKIISKGNSESAERRIKLKEANEKLAEFERKEKEEKEKELKAKGKHEEIITDLKSKLEKAEPLANEYTDYLNKKKEVIKTSLTEKGLWVESFDSLKLSELETLDNKFKEGLTKVDTDTGNNFVKNKNGIDTREPWEKMKVKE